MLVHVVADYGPAGDLAFAEVAQRLVLALPSATIVATPVAPFDTLAAGFVVAQLALNDGPAERVVFHNVAPRRDEANPRRANEGERFTAVETPNGTLVVGPNSGYSLAFVRDQAPMFYLDVPAAGSRSSPTAASRWPKASWRWLRAPRVGRYATAASSACTSCSCAGEARPRLGHPPSGTPVVVSPA